MQHEHHAGHGGNTTSALEGISLSGAGLVLSAVSAPRTVGLPGELTLSIRTDEGDAVTSFSPSHGREVHLIVVRSDGAQFRHVHPTVNPHTGEWVLPWVWHAAGTYRVFVDITAPNGASVTLTRTVDVSGPLAAVAAEPHTVSQVDGYTVTLTGTLAAKTSSELVFEVTRAGVPVQTLQPYLGAFGHLVALRQGDLAFLHVHPDGAEPGPADLGGASISFAAHVPTAGRYLLYLDFQVEDVVHTATFVLDASHPTVHAVHAAHA